MRDLENSYKRAIETESAGLVGSDPSGNDPDFMKPLDVLDNNVKVEEVADIGTGEEQ